MLWKCFCTFHRVRIWSSLFHNVVWSCSLCCCWRTWKWNVCFHSKCAEWEYFQTPLGQAFISSEFALIDDTPPHSFLVYRFLLFVSMWKSPRSSWLRYYDTSLFCEESAVSSDCGAAELHRQAGCSGNETTASAQNHTNPPVLLLMDCTWVPPGPLWTVSVLKAQTANFTFHCSYFCDTLTCPCPWLNFVHAPWTCRIYRWWHQPLIHLYVSSGSFLRSAMKSARRRRREPCLL